MLIQSQPSTSTRMTSSAPPSPVSLSNVETPACEPDYPLLSNSPRITVKTNDEAVYTLPVRAASLSSVLKRASHALRSNQTSNPKPYNLPNVSSSALELIMRYCYYHASASVSGALLRDRSSWDVEFLRRDPRELCELASAAYYLEVPELVDLTCLAIAAIISGKSAEQIRATFHIQDDLQDFEQMLPSMLPLVRSAVNDVRHKVRRKVTHVPGDSPRTSSSSASTQNAKKTNLNATSKLSVEELSEWINSGDGKKKKKKKRNRDKTKHTDQTNGVRNEKEKTQNLSSNDNPSQSNSAPSMEPDTQNMVNHESPNVDNSSANEGSEGSSSSDPPYKSKGIHSKEKQATNAREGNHCEKHQNCEDSHFAQNDKRKKSTQRVTFSDDSDIIIVKQTKADDVISIDSSTQSSSQHSNSTDVHQLGTHAYRRMRAKDESSKSRPKSFCKQEASSNSNEDHSNVVNGSSHTSNENKFNENSQLKDELLTKGNTTFASFIDCPENMDREVEAFKKRLQLSGKSTNRTKLGQIEDKCEKESDEENDSCDESSLNHDQHIRSDKNDMRARSCDTSLKASRRNRSRSEPHGQHSKHEEQKDDDDIEIVHVSRSSRSLVKQEISPNKQLPENTKQVQIAKLQEKAEKITFRAREIDDEIGRLTAEREQIRDSLAEVRVELSILKNRN